MIKKISLNIIIPIILLVPLFVYSQTVQPPSIDVSIPNPTNAGSDLIAVITTLLENVILPIAAVIVVMWIIWAGFTYLMAQGKPEEIRKANQRLLWSLIGAGILLGSVGIAQVVKTTFQALIN